MKKLKVCTGIMLLALLMLVGCKNSETNDGATAINNSVKETSTVTENTNDTETAQAESEAVATTETESMEVKPEPTYVNYVSGTYDQPFVLKLIEEEVVHVVVERENTFEGVISYEEFTNIAVGDGETAINLRLTFDTGETQMLNLNYSVDYPQEVIRIQDPVVEAELRSRLNLDETAAITNKDVDTIVSVGISGDGIVFSENQLPLQMMDIYSFVFRDSTATELGYSIADLSVFPNLTSIYAKVPIMEEIDGIELNHLNTVYLESDEVCSDVLNQFPIENIVMSGVKSLTYDFAKAAYLRTLSLEMCSAPNISDISKTAALKSLNLSFSKFDSLEFIGELKYLEELSLNGMNPTEASLADMQENSLIEAGKVENRTESISELGFLSDLHALKSLSLSYNQIEDISLLEQFEAMEELELAHNPITDFTPLSKLKHLIRLNISSTNAENLDFLSDTTKLQELIAYFCKITSIDAIKNNQNMSFLWVGGNAITDMQVIENFPHLKRLIIDANKITDASPVLKCTEIEEITIYDNPLENPEVLDSFGENVWVRK